MARAAGLLHHVLLDNSASKQAVLEAAASEDREGSLLVRCCRQLANMLASGQQGSTSHIGLLISVQSAGLSDMILLGYDPAEVLWALYKEIQRRVECIGCPV